MMEKELIVKEIYIYPVKGLKGISLSSCKVTEVGLDNDRVYMIADEKGQLISQRTHSVLSLMEVRRKDEAWEIAYEDDDILIQDGNMLSEKMKVNLWDVVFSCHEVSKEASAWFAKHLGTPCKLMVMPNKQSRVKEFNKPPYKTYLSFADGYPVSTLGTESMTLLNQKLKEPINANRFRSNLVIETNTPHEEDLWGDFKIGEEVTLRNIKPCVRCEVITIDQELGTKGKEPLKTLASYRRVENSVCFASNVIVLAEGEIKVGDVVFVKY